MSVVTNNDHGYEVLKKVADEVNSGDNREYFFKVKEVNPSTTVAKTLPKIYNIIIPTANTEQELALSNNTKSILIRSRNKCNVQLSFVDGESDSNYITLRPNAVYEERGISVSNLSIYFQSDTDNSLLEVLEWS